MDGHTFTTKGWLPEAEVELRPMVEDTASYTMTRTDKFLRATGEWVGNDLHCEIKQPLVMWGETEKVG